MNLIRFWNFTKLKYQIVRQADISMQLRAPYASTTGSNRLPGNIYLNIEVAAGRLQQPIIGSVNFTWQEVI